MLIAGDIDTRTMLDWNYGGKRMIASMEPKLLHKEEGTIALSKIKSIADGRDAKQKVQKIYSTNANYEFK